MISQYCLVFLIGVLICSVFSATNLALLKPTIASSTFSGYSSTRITDGSNDTSLGSSSSWVNDGGAPSPHWVYVDFGSPVQYDYVVLFTSSGYEIQDYNLEVSNNTVSWLIVYQVTGNTDTMIASSIPTVTSRYLRVLGVSGPPHQSFYRRVNELEVYIIGSTSPTEASSTEDISSTEYTSTQYSTEDSIFIQDSIGGSTSTQESMSEDIESQATSLDDSSFNQETTALYATDRSDYSLNIQDSSVEEIITLGDIKDNSKIFASDVIIVKEVNVGTTLNISESNVTFEQNLLVTGILSVSDSIIKVNGLFSLDENSVLRLNTNSQIEVAGCAKLSGTLELSSISDKEQTIMSYQCYEGQFNSVTTDMRDPVCLSYNEKNLIVVLQYDDSCRHNFGTDIEIVIILHLIVIICSF